MKNIFLLVVFFELLFMMVLTGCEDGKLKFLTEFGLLPSVREIQETISDDLPEGTSLEGIMGYLSSKGISHTYDKKQNHVRAAINWIKGSSILYRRDMYIVFHLNKQKRLKSIEFKPLYTGL